MGKRILITSTELMMLQFLVPYCKMLTGLGYEVDVACSEVGGRYQEILEKLPLQIVKYRIASQRSPLKLKQNFKGYRQLCKLFNAEEYDLVWTNEPVMGVITRLAARSARKKGMRVMYMTHGLHFYKGSGLINWLMFYPVEKLLGRITDMLVTISGQDLLCVKKKNICKSARRIHGIGASDERFTPVSDERKNEIRREFSFSREDYICVCVGELTDNKNQEVLLRAVPDIIGEFPGFRLVLCGTGNLRDKYLKIISELKLEHNVFLMGYRNDIEKFYQMADFVASASIREGLGLNLIEAMLCKKPVIGSINRGHCELITDGLNGYLFNPSSSEEFSAFACTLCRARDEGAAMGGASLGIAEGYSLECVKKEITEIIDEQFILKKCESVLTPESLRRLQLTQLEILKVISNICEKYSIEYTLYGGTLLGAVRHKGFIPWDDDLDIAMTRENYDLFRMAFENESPEGYIFQEKENDPEFTRTFGKVRKCGTEFYGHDEIGKNYNHGIFVDIFPFDKVRNNGLSRAWHILVGALYLLYARGYTPVKNGTAMRIFSGILLRAVPKRSYNSICQKCKAYLTKACPANDYYYITYTSFRTLKWKLDKSMFKNFTLLPFEDMQAMATDAYDMYMKTMYGDYMQPPPEDKRKGSHIIVKLSFGNEEEVVKEEEECSALAESQ